MSVKDSTNEITWADIAYAAKALGLLGDRDVILTKHDFLQLHDKLISLGIAKRAAPGRYRVTILEEREEAPEFTVESAPEPKSREREIDAKLN